MRIMIILNNQVIETKLVRFSKSALQRLVAVKKAAAKVYGKDVEVRFETI